MEQFYSMLKYNGRSDRYFFLRGYAFGADRKSGISYPLFRPLAVHKVQLRVEKRRILHPKSYARAVNWEMSETR